MLSIIPILNPQTIADCQRGDPDAQRQLYEHFLPYVAGICRRFNIHSSDLKDVIQDVFIEVFVSIKNYDAQRGALKYYIKQIAVHKILNRLRKRKLRTAPIEDLPPNREPAARIDLRTLNTEYLVELIAALPDGYRTVFNLYVIDGYSHNEIADLLRISASASRSQLSRARQLLQHQIEAIRRYETK